MNGRGYLWVLSQQIFVIDHETITGRDYLLVLSLQFKNGAKEVTSKKESKMAEMTVQHHCTNSHWLTQIHQAVSTND